MRDETDDQVARRLQQALEEVEAAVALLRRVREPSARASSIEFALGEAESRIHAAMKQLDL